MHILLIQTPNEAPARQLPRILEIGRTYQTIGGESVKMVGFGATNVGTSYETMVDQHGVHRYSRRDIGRVTGTSHENPDPRNIAMAVPFEIEHLPVQNAELRQRNENQAATIETLQRQVEALSVLNVELDAKAQETGERLVETANQLLLTTRRAVNAEQERNQLAWQILQEDMAA